MFKYLDLIFSHVGDDVRILIGWFQHPIGVDDEVFVHVRPRSTLCHISRQTVVGGVAISSALGVQKTQVLVSKVVDEVFGKNNFHVVWIASELDAMSYRHIKTTICKNSQRFRPVDFS